jgi:hypothetical protein
MGGGFRLGFGRRRGLQWQRMSRTQRILMASAFVAIGVIATALGIHALLQLQAQTAHITATVESCGSHRRGGENCSVTFTLDGANDSADIAVNGAPSPGDQVALQVDPNDPSNASEVGVPALFDYLPFVVGVVFLLLGVYHLVVGPRRAAGRSSSGTDLPVGPGLPYDPGFPPTGGGPARAGWPHGSSGTAEYGPAPGFHSMPEPQGPYPQPFSAPVPPPRSPPPGPPTPVDTPLGPQPPPGWS